MAVQLALSSYLAHLANEEANRQEQVRTYRSYYEGDPPTKLTSRQATFLNVDRDKKFGANVCAPIIDTLKERLEVTGFAVQAGAKEGGEETDTLSETLDTWWQKNRMDAKQDWVHLAALRDREAFVVVGYDNEHGYPTYDHDYAYDGSNGVKVHCKPGTYNELAFASKRWIVYESSKTGTKRRLNLYFPNRIEKWVSTTAADAKLSELGWKPLDEDGLELVKLEDEAGQPYMAAVSWWTDDATANGKPLGVPIIPFRNRDDGTGEGLSELDNAIPLQDAINKCLLDLIAAGDMTGWQMYWTTGKQPSGGFKLYPGGMLPIVAPDGVDDPTKAQVGVLAAGDLSQLISQLNTLVALLAGISGTPQSRFTPSAIRPSGETQKQEQEALIAKAKGLHKVFGNAWEDVQRMGLKVQAAFGEPVTADPEAYIISTQWADVEVRNEKDHVEAVAMKVEKAAVPVSQAWKELGYSASEQRDFARQYLRSQSDILLARANQNGKSNGKEPTNEPAGTQTTEPPPPETP